jgi:glycosyltransferase 2 family protein
MHVSLRTALVAILAVVLLGLFLRHADLRQVWTEIERSRWDLVAFALIATGVTYVLRAIRWQYLLAPIGTVRFSTAFRTTIIGFAATALLPARAGEVLRPYLLARQEGLSATAAFATIILERVLDTMMVLLLFGVFLLASDPGVAGADVQSFSRLKAGGVAVALASVAALVGMFVLAGHPGMLAGLERAIVGWLPARLAAKATGLVHAFAEGLAIVRQPGRLAVVLAWSVPLWLSIAVGIWAVSRAFHIELPFVGSFLIMALLVIGVAVPTPGAVGGFHYFYRLGAVTFYGAPNERAVGAAIVLHAVSFVPVAIVGLIFLAQDGLSLASVGRLARSRGAEEAT